MPANLSAQSSNIVAEAEEAMLNATRFMVEEVSTNGGYLWNYLPDMSRRWGEMEAYETMIWVQPPGTVSMTHTFLDAYQVTGQAYYFEAAEKAVEALIWGQSEHGGWNYFIDFAGYRSMKKWYSTIGKNGWRLEEFQYYYGNDTFDDDVTTEAARVILRMYLENLDPKYKPALDKAINFILESQYPLGGWPQRYPLRYDYVKNGVPDYTSYYTFNDDVVWENIHFLVQCYLTLGNERFLDPIRRGMNFYLLTLGGNPQAGWAMQHDMDLQPAQARSYEPKSLSPTYTFSNAMFLIRFYEFTGDRRYLARIPDIIEWLEETKLDEKASEDGYHVFPSFVELETNKPLYVHRRGSNVKHGEYYVDHKDEKLILHSSGKRTINLQLLIDEYERVKDLSPAEATKNSPLKSSRFKGEGTPQNDYDLYRTSFDLDTMPDEKTVREIIASLDEQNRWLTTQVNTSNPYVGEGQKTELTEEYATTNVGDKTDTSPYRDKSGQKYISTRQYIRNMNLLLKFIEEYKD
ncbi:MAG: pectate lyase [Balneolaceae bacterium]